MLKAHTIQKGTLKAKTSLFSLAYSYNLLPSTFFAEYIGVKNKGDFTLITSHPIKVLDQYEIVHSHGPFSSWIDVPEFKNFNLSIHSNITNL